MPGNEAKHAAKKVAKKAAKKVAKKAAGKHGAGQDVRRAYEHLHRVGVLHKQLQREAFSQIDTLSRLAQSALREGDAKSAADLLRAAEHYAFGSLALEAAEANIGDDLAQAARDEYEHLRARAAERWAGRGGDTSRELAEIHKAMLSAAQTAFKTGALHRALEFARGAEALTHADVSGTRKLAAAKKVAGQLRG